MLGGDGATTSEGVAAVPAEHMATRAEKKARTRNALMDSVLHIVGVGANFASISLREVAKTAGVVPTSFYRHFGDMEELGLAMIDDLSLKLRRLTRGSLDPAEPLEQLIDRCMEAYQTEVLENTNLFEFLNQSRTGGTAALRAAIRNEIAFFTSRVSTEVGRLLPKLKAADRELAAGLIVAALLEHVDALLAAHGEEGGGEAQVAELRERMGQQIRLILLGAGQLQGRVKRLPRAVQG